MTSISSANHPIPRMSRHAKLPFHGLLFSISFGVFFGLLDFLFFEIYRNRPVFHELIFAKPNLFGLSYLAFHILSFAIMAGLIYILIVFIKKFFCNNRLFTRVVTIGVFSLAIFSMRIKRIDEQPYFTLIFSLVIFATIWVLVRRSRKYFHRSKPKHYDDVDFPRWVSVIAIFVVLATFTAPDLYGFYSRLLNKNGSQNRDQPNVLILVLDTLRADHVSSYGYTANHTPILDKIASRGVLFLNARASAPWTLPSHASMFTGLPTSVHQADWGHKYLSDDFLTLAEYLRGIGYRTAGFCENPNVSRANGLAQGFSQFHETWRAPLFVRATRRFNTKVPILKHRHEYTGRTAGLLRRWIRSEQQIGGPFFAYVNFMAPHLPRYPRKLPGAKSWKLEALRRIEPVNIVPERYYLDRYRLDEEDLAVMRDIYDQEISFLDHELGSLMDFLEETDVLENTILIVTSDHGENFGENGFIEHQFRLDESLIHVPLIIRYPKLLKPEILEKNISTSKIFDIVKGLVNVREGIVESESEFPRFVATLMEETDQSVISEYFSGIEMMKRAIRSESDDFDFSPYDLNIKSIIIGDYKYISYSTGKEELFNIEADPKELLDLSAEKPELVRDLRKMLWESVDDEGIATDRDNAPPVDQATKEALKALGYVY